MEKIKYLKKEEVDRLLSKVESTGSLRDLAIFHLAYFLGLRASEVGILTVDDYNASANEIFVRRLKGSVSGSRRLDAKRNRILKRYLTLRNDTFTNNRSSPLLFLSRQENRGIGRKRLHVLMRKYGGKANLPVDRRHFHALRHSIGVHMAEATFDLKEIQWALGHKSIATTQIYHTFTTAQQDSFYLKLKEHKRFISG